MAQTITTIDIKDSIFPEEKEHFPWDDEVLQAFKNTIKDQGIKCRMDDIFLLGILRARKYDIQRSLQLLKNYYSVRLQYPQYFKNLLPSKLEHALNLNIVEILPNPDQKGRYLAIFRSDKWDTSIVNVTDMFRSVMLCVDLQLNFHRMQENKLVGIVNAEGTSLSHFLQLSPSLLNSMVNVLFRDSYQLRYAEIHYVNLNVIVKAVGTVFVSLLPSKLKQRIHFHSDMATLHEFVSPEYLPVEYGGKLPSSDQTAYYNMIKANEEFYRKNEDYLQIYEEEINNNFTQGKFRYITNEDDEKAKKFIEKSEEKFKSCSEDPEAFLAALKEDSEFEITHF